MKHIYLNPQTLNLLQDKHIFLDANFINLLFNNEQISTEFISALPPSFIYIDPLVEFEFLRDVFLPKQRDLKEEFVSQDLFSPMTNRQETFLHQQENALLLSKIYAQQHVKKGYGIVDLFLAGRIMLAPNQNLLITQNKKDFPPCVFDSVSVIDTQNEGGEIDTYFVLKFNESRFTEMYRELSNLESDMSQTPE